MFVDTAAWYALQTRRDARSSAAQTTWRQLVSSPRSLVTTNVVVGETYTLIRMRHGYDAAWRFIGSLDRTRRLARHHVTPDIEAQAYLILRQYEDQDFSYEDATSFAFMRWAGITEAFAFDAHFATAGFSRIPPQP